jgi:hypothetical protein
MTLSPFKTTSNLNAITLIESQLQDTWAEPLFNISKYQVEVVFCSPGRRCLSKGVDRDLDLADSYVQEIPAEILSTPPLILKDASRTWWILEHQRGHTTCQQGTAAITKQFNKDAWSRHMDAQLQKHCFPASRVQQAPVGRLGLEASDLPVTSEGIFLASARFDDEIDCTPVICFALDALKTSARWTIRENSLHRVAFERKQHLPLLAHAAWVVRSRPSVL